MNENSFLLDFATHRTMEDGRQSCLLQTLTDARTICGYNTQTTHITPSTLLDPAGNPVFTTSFSGLILYLVSLEMMGKVFNKKPNKKDTQKHGCKRAIEQFSNLSKEIKFAIVALRNSLVHATGLINIPPHKNKLGLDRHKFSLDYTTQGDVIEFPTVGWNGNFTAKADSQSTTVRVIPLILAIEDIYTHLVDDLGNGHIELNLDGGLEELKARYTIPV